MLLPGPFEILRVLEFLWPEREPGFLLTGISCDDILATRTGADPSFVDPATGLLVMSFHSLVVRTPAGVLLVDTCVGNHKDRPMLPEWHRQEWPYLERLAGVGLTPADIDFICCTHLHGDHVGWNTRMVDGSWVPTFPNARYLFARSELDYWQTHHDEEPESMYRRPWEDSVLPVIAAGQVDAVADDAEILPGICLRPAPGHTPGHTSLQVNLPETGPVFLTGDLYHRTESRELRRVPQFNADVEGAETPGAETRASMEAFEAAVTDAGGQVIIQHERADVEDLPDVIR